MTNLLPRSDRFVTVHSVRMLYVLCYGCVMVVCFVLWLCYGCMFCSLQLNIVNYVPLLLCTLIVIYICSYMGRVAQSV